MTSYLRGSKRLKVIQQYLNGVENPDWEVFPSRTEGKYVIRPRKPTSNTSNEPPTNESEEPAQSNENEISSDITDEPATNDTDETSQVIENVVPPTQPVSKSLKSTSSKPNLKSLKKPLPTNEPFDPTVSLEILTQLKTLGDELRQEREAKHQKKLIKQTVRDQLYKAPYRLPQQIVTEPDYDDYNDASSDDESALPPPPPPKPMYVRRRLNLVNR